MYQLREYQKQAVNRTVHYFRHRKEPAVIVLPTGAGKSLVIAELARIAKGRVLVLAHVKELVEQNHQKYCSYDLQAGIYSAGLNQKSDNQKVIFGSIQSVANAGDHFFSDFSLVVIDECHRVGLDAETQYGKVIAALRQHNPDVCILGLTATPYRLGLGWIYNFHFEGEVKTTEPRFFTNCIYELPLRYMIAHKYLTQPVKVDIPVTSYDFSDLDLKDGRYTMSDIEDALGRQNHLTPLIVKNIIDIAETYQRHGVMIFASTVQHAKSILEVLPEGQAQLVIGDTAQNERDRIVTSFKNKEFRYLVNVSVLTTGFDASHVDVIAILRPTESASLYQQIVGRGLRLAPDKQDCLILDYAGINYNLFAPEIDDKRPAKESVAVQVECPKCGFINDFWGRVDPDGDIIEHYGRKCRGGEFNETTFKVEPCGFRFRFKLCAACGEENDIAARTCCACHEEMNDAKTLLKQARLSKDAHVLEPDSVEFLERHDSNGKPYLEIRYYDHDAKYLSEAHFFNSVSSRKRFDVNFLRSHLLRPEVKPRIRGITDVMRLQNSLRMPRFVIGRKQGKFWKVTEKIFAEELR